MKYKRRKEVVIEFGGLGRYEDIDKGLIRGFEIYVSGKNVCGNRIVKYVKCVKRGLRVGEERGEIKERIEEVL